jgi:hypothetical protein
MMERPEAVREKVSHERLRGGEDEEAIEGGVVEKGASTTFGEPLQ